jgi:protoheme ferro-lyase
MEERTFHQLQPDLSTHGLPTQTAMIELHSGHYQNAIANPYFVSDCLETLEANRHEGEEIFM